jgi:hypothetical protein
VPAPSASWVQPGLDSVEFTTRSVRSPKYHDTVDHSDWTTPPQISLFFGLTSDMVQNYAFEFRDNVD